MSGLAGKFAELTRSRNYRFDTLMTSGWVIFGKSFGFFVQLFIAFFFGANRQTDLFFLAFTILLYVTVAIGEAPRRALVLFIAEKTSCRDDPNGFLNHVLTSGWLLLAVLLGLIAAGLPPLMRMTALYDENATATLMRHFLLGAPMVFFICGTCWVSGLLDYHKKFWISAAAPALRSAAALAVLFAFRRHWGIYAAMAGYVVGEAALFLVTVSAARRITGFRPQWRVGDPRRLGPFVSTAGFLVAASAAALASSVVDRLVASWVGAGNLSLLQYSSTIVFTLHGVFIAGFETVLIAYWSEAFHSGRNRAGLRANFALRAVETLAISVPVCLICWFFRQEIARLLFLRGSFPPQAAPELAEIFGLQVFALIPWPILIALSHYFIVIRKTGVLFAAALIRVVLAVACDLALAPRLGVRGIALSTTIQTSLLALFLYSYFVRGGREARTRPTSETSPGATFE
ncbi:MAG TPA: lipid II flippase MurJ [Candidatus Eisenbacteria bacterium]|nr:lipid II flippase MurJ [Candidatus Eisenbacteria bacterium]